MLGLHDGPSPNEFMNELNQSGDEEDLAKNLEKSVGRAAHRPRRSRIDERTKTVSQPFKGGLR